MQTKGAEIEIADRLLKGVLVQLLRPDANMADHVEGSLPNAGGLRLQGKLRLCAALIRVLKRYSVGACSGGGLIEKLLVGGHKRSCKVSCTLPLCCDGVMACRPTQYTPAKMSALLLSAILRHLWLLACAEYLFPAANLMAKQKEDPNFSLAMVPHAELYVALNARCSTKASRQVCAAIVPKRLPQQHHAVLSFTI